MRRWVRILLFLLVLFLPEKSQAAPAISRGISPSISKIPSPTESYNCGQVFWRLVGSYECKKPDENFARHYAELLCRCKEFIPQNPYSVDFRNSPECAQKLSQCIDAIAPNVIAHIQSCLSSPPLESLTCRLFDVDDAVANSSDYQLIQEAKTACYP